MYLLYILPIFGFQTYMSKGSSCGSVGKAVASDTRDPRFQSSHWYIFYHQLNGFCAENTKIKKKNTGNGPIQKNTLSKIPRFKMPTTHTYL